MIKIAALVLAAASGVPVEHQAGDPPPEIVCSLTQHCTVELPAGERLRAAVLGDPERWIVTAESYGHPERDFLALRPRKCGIKTRLTLATTRALHTFDLEGRCDAGDEKSPSTSSVTDLVLLPATVAGAVVRQDPPPPAPPVLDHAFHVEAPRRLERRGRVPTVATDGVRTFLTWPEGLPTLPTVRLLRDGEAVTLPNPVWSHRNAVLTLDALLGEGDELELDFGRKTVTVRRPPR